MKNPIAFISYSWENETHSNWVRELATQLQNNGVFVHLDQWDIRLGMDLPSYMETSVRESQFVLLVCTPSFAERANAGTGGVGYEKSIVTGEIFTRASKDTKFIPILRGGDPIASLPSFLKSKVYVDMRDSARLPSAIEDLLRHIHDEPITTRPSVGDKPSFATSRSKVATDDSTNVAKAKPSSIQADRTAQPLFDLARFKELRDFAYRPSGLDLSADAATAWAEDRMKDKTTFDLQRFIELRDFAFQTGGLDLTADAAAAWAEERMRDKTPFDLTKFKELRDFAYRPSGLDLSADVATTWAEDRMKDTIPFDLQRFIELRDFAYSTAGLDLSADAAATWALSKLKS